MYGKPLDPKKSGFSIEPDMDGQKSETQFTIFVTDLEDRTNDDVRDIDHPDWDRLWGNAMENVFEPWDQSTVSEGFFRDSPSDLKALDTITKARAWLLSIGMIEI